MSEELIRVCRTDELAPGEARLVPHDPPIALFNVDGEFFATADTCTHADFSLVTGYIEGDKVECVLHMAKFDIKTGAPMNYPATIPLKTYPVSVVDDEVFVDPTPKSGE